MMRNAFGFRTLVITLTVVAASGWGASAEAKVYVLQSTAATVKVGAAYAMEDRISVPAGASIRVVMPSGKTQTIRGPYSGLIADLAQGQQPNQGVMAWLKTLLQTGGANERTPGATRSFRAPEPPPGFSWTAIPAMADSTICVKKNAKLHLRRAHSQRAERITVVDVEDNRRGDVEFAPGRETAPWPAALTPRPNGTYLLLASDNRPRRQVTLRVLDRLPSEDDLLAELAGRNCKHQFDAWVKEKLAAGKKAS